MLLNDEIANLNKALQAGYGTDSAALTGGGALRLQSLDHTLQSLLFNQAHFSLTNKMPVETCTATVDEWVEQSDVGGFLGGSANTEMGVISDATGVYARRVGMVKHLITRRQVSVVGAAQQGILNMEAAEIQNGALQLLRDREVLCFEGSSAVNPVEFDGLDAQIKSLGTTNIIDMKGAALSAIDPISDAAQTIAYHGNGNPSDIYANYSVITDLNNALNPAFRIGLGDKPLEVTSGTPLSKINTSFGVITVNQNRFVRDEHEKVPFQLLQPSIAAANNFTPSGLAAASQIYDPATSKFDVNSTGNYFYFAAGINQNGQSNVIYLGQFAQSTGYKYQFTINASATGLETGYVIYRGRKNGTNALTDIREMMRIPRTGAQTTFIDDNSNIPGTTSAYVLDMGVNGTRPLVWRSLISMAKMDLTVSNQLAKTWAQFISGYLRVSIRQRHVLIKNIVPNTAAWKPFV